MAVLSGLAGPAMAAPADIASTLVGLAWLGLGLALGLAAAFVACWWVLRARVAPRSGWGPFALTALVALPVLAWLGPRAPVPSLLLVLALVAWGLWLVNRLSRRVRALLDERDHAKAEAKRAQLNSERDALTGIYNRGALRQRLERLAEETWQDGRPLSLLYFDIDLFKLINDSLGHAVGDECLKAVAAVVGSELRGGDVLGRLGGEEFAVVLPGAKRIHAIAVAERIRQAVQNQCRVVGEEVVELTVSLGAAEFLGPQESMDALMDRADRAMYQAKDSGRNMVVADPGTPGPRG
ncbi:GGDEF domain-containing protein [Arenimonas fontis]|uniref:GGDEF domain-containing protein n=1 Tax=Arenimonas fontis TaxID=2608255 RepID=UPI001661EE41|nr:GGDEF domain-containing protein [Arenimonas fontis]